MRVASRPVDALGTLRVVPLGQVDGPCPPVSTAVPDAVEMQLQPLSWSHGHDCADIDAAGPLDAQAGRATRWVATGEALLCGTLGLFSAAVVYGLSGRPFAGAAGGIALAALGWNWRRRAPIRSEIDGL